MKPKVRIGLMADHDMRHYEFARKSGLPIGYFDRGWRLRTWLLAIIAAIITAILFTKP